MDYTFLMEKAKEVIKNSYSPYSGFSVGAALLTGDGRIFCGCNIENASFGATICAERSAFAAAISDGAKNFEALAVVGADKNGVLKDGVMPCGICRQVMAEFCDGDFKIIVYGNGKIKTVLLSELLPSAFTDFRK